MKVTQFSHRALRYRRFAKEMALKGYEPIAENGAPLGRLARGYYGMEGRIILDAKVDPTGTTVYIKISEPHARFDLYL